MNNGRQVAEYYNGIKNLTGKSYEHNPIDLNVYTFTEKVLKYATALSKYRNVISIEDFIEITGMGRSRTWKLIRDDKLKTINLNDRFRLIPRVWVLEYFTTEDFSNYIEWKK